MRVRIPRDQFDRYLRTGIWVSQDASCNDIEIKFNPWHDPDTGRFTFKGGGGGSGGGGGASGTWQGGGSLDGGGVPRSLGKPSPSKAGSSAPRKQSSVAPVVQAAAAASDTSTSQSRVIVRNGYTYTLDAADRTTSVTGTLTLTSDQQRSRNAQATAGGNDRLTTDDGGHYIAARFNGPTDTFNHFAQDANFNRGGYRVLENGWANDIKAGKQVYVAITPSYSGSSLRPSTINVVYSVNGDRGSRRFPNSSKGKPRGK